jgi:hypothetical protein
VYKIDEIKAEYLFCDISRNKINEVIGVSIMMGTKKTLRVKKSQSNPRLNKIEEIA